MPKNKAHNEVGYGRPPKSGRFKPGESGNPKGRPKGARNLASDLADELAETIRIRESGKELKVSKQRAMVKSLVAAAVQGDVRATTALVSLCARVMTESKASKPEELSETDAKILDEFVDREVKRRDGRTSKLDDVNAFQIKERK
jgi:hypothetical protein